MVKKDPHSESDDRLNEDSANPSSEADDLDKTVDLTFNETTINIESVDPANADSETAKKTRDGQHQTVVRRGNSDVTVPILGKTVEIQDETVEIGSSLMSGDDLGATINPREMSPHDADIWATQIAGTSVEKVTGKPTVSILVTDNRQSDDTTISLAKTNATLDITQLDSADDLSIEVSQGNQGNKTDNRDVPAIERTLSDRNFDRLRTCGISSPKSKSTSNSDYRLIRKLGQGGMGDVFVARQGSLDRLLALKLIKPIEGARRQKLIDNGRLEDIEAERRLQFLSEAIITGDLDHPNIVPIHDVALTPNGDLFYSMKRVIGTPWSETIESMSQDENIEVLLKVCDAIAQAHTRGVVHRDIKPENIMLGEFGVVMVMDWGLALPTSTYAERRPESVLTTTGLGGTPAFMAPEMAVGPVDRIGPSADIYLLGATLFLIITGKPPHHGSNVTECLKAVRENEIRSVEPELNGELLDIATRAMESNPDDRYPMVTDFQQAVRDYLKHAGSINQSRQARESLQVAKQEQSYEHFSAARYQFQDALALWDENIPAKQGLNETLIAHSEASLVKEDYDLGLSLLDAGNAEHQDLIAKLEGGKKERRLRETRLRLMKRLAVAMLAFILIGGSVAIYSIEKQRRSATAARDLAERQEKIAIEQTKIAVDQKLIAENQRMIAESQTAEATRQRTKAEEETRRAESLARAEAAAKDDALNQTRIAKAERVKAETARLEAVESEKVAEAERANAEQKRNEAIAATKRASYEEYVSKIGLAKARLEQNETEVARKILRELKESSSQAIGWEWQWLWRQANGAEQNIPLEQSAIDLSAISGAGKGIVLLADDRAKWFRAADDGDVELSKTLTWNTPTGGSATKIAAMPDGKRFVLGFAGGDVWLHDGRSHRLIGRHKGVVNDIVLIDDRFGVTASTDRTVRVWDLKALPADNKAAKPLATCWHGLPVDRVDAVKTADGQFRIASATSSDNAGEITVWEASISSGGSTGSDVSVVKQGVFRGHDRPVTSVALRHDGRLAASGDIDGSVLVWNPMATPRVDYPSEIRQALSGLEDQTPQPKTASDSEKANRPRQRFLALIDPSLRQSGRLISVKSPTGLTSDLAHRDRIASLSFDLDGSSIVSASNDYTLKTWDVNSRKLEKKLRGHGGWVTAAKFVGNGSNRLVSIADDQSIRVWNPTTYLDEAIEIEDNAARLIGQPTETNRPKNPANPAAPATLGRMLGAHSKPISSARFSTDSTKVVTASADHTARVMTIDPRTMTFQNSVALESNEIDSDPARLGEGTAYIAMSMAVDSDYRTIAVGYADAVVRLWDVDRGVQLAKVAGTGLNNALAMSGDGKWLVTGSSSKDEKLIIWKIDPTRTEKPKPVHRLSGHDQAVTALALSQDGKTLFSGDAIGFGLFWNVETGKPIGDPIGNVRGFRIGAAAFSTDDQSLWIGADDEQLTQIDLRTRKNLRQLNHDGFVTQISLSESDKYAVTISEFVTTKSIRTTAKLWDLQTGRSVNLETRNGAVDSNQGRGSGNRNRVTTARIGKLGHGIIVCGSNQNGTAAIRRWKTPAKLLSQKSAEQNAKPDLAFELPARLGTVAAAMPLADSQCLTLNQNAVFRWRYDDGKLLRSYRDHAPLTEAAISPDGKWVATASRSLKLWDAETGKAVDKIETPHVGPVHCVDFQPTTNPNPVIRFVTGGDDGVARTWDWTPGEPPKPVATFNSFRGNRINVVRFSPDGKRLLIAGDQGNAEIRMTDSGKVAWQLADPKAGDDFHYLCGDFSDDGNVAALGTSEDLALVWQLGDQPGSVRQLTRLAGHADKVQGIQISGNSDSMYRVFTASADDSVKVWDPKVDSDTGLNTNAPQIVAGRELLSLRRHSGDVNAIALSHDGRLMMTAGQDGRVILWPSNRSENAGEALLSK